jgi:hypothetical protein
VPFGGNEDEMYTYATYHEVMEPGLEYKLETSSDIPPPPRCLIHPPEAGMSHVSIIQHVV